jgi:hypothetical protein
VSDSGRELAALKAVVQQQHEATLRTFQEVTALCQQQQAQLEQLSRSLDELRPRADGQACNDSSGVVCKQPEQM